MLRTGFSIPQGHSEQLTKVLAAKLNRDSDRDIQLYSTSGHIFLLGDLGRELHIFTSGPLSGHQRFSSSDKWGTHLEFPENPIINILFYGEGASTFLTVHRGGSLYQWKFDPSLRTWHQLSMLDLECGDGEVEAVVLHKGHSALYWSQRQETVGTSKYTIYTATINTDGDEDLALGYRHSLLTDCPPCTLHPAGDSLLVSFREPAPPGVYVTWRPVNRTLSMCVHGYGVVTKRQVYTHAVSFHQMALQSSALWAQSTPTTDWTLVEHGRLGVPRFVAKDGSLWRVSNDGLLVRECCLKRWAEVLGDTPQSVSHHLGILTVTSNSLWLHSVETGAVLGTALPEVKVTGIWAAVSTAEAGFVTPKGLLEVSMKVSGPGDHGDVAEEGSRWLQLLTLAPTSPDSEGHTRLQSPALHLTALHQTRDDIDLASRRQLINYLNKKKPAPPTKLQASLEPLVRKFAELEDLQGHLFQNPQPFSTLTVEEEISDLLPPGDDLSHHDVYFRVTLLRTRSADRVAAAILARTALVPHESVSSSDQASSYLRSTHGRPVLVLASRLLFMTRPDCLIEFLNHILNSGSDDTAAFQKQTQAPLYNEILQNLPSHHASHDNKMAVRALATIISKSGGERCEEKSLTLLIRNKLWREAADLLEKLPPKSDHFVRLYWALVMAATQEGAFPALSDSLLDIAPPNLSLVSLLHQMRTAVRTANSGKADPTQHNADFPIGKLVQYLNAQMDISPPP